MGIKPTCSQDGETLGYCVGESEGGGHFPVSFFSFSFVFFLWAWKKCDSTYQKKITNSKFIFCSSHGPNKGYLVRVSVRDHGRWSFLNSLFSFVIFLFLFCSVLFFSSLSCHVWSTRPRAKFSRNTEQDRINAHTMLDCNDSKLAHCHY